MTKLRFFEYRVPLITLGALQLFVGLGTFVGGLFLLVGNEMAATVVSQDFFELNPAATYLGPALLIMFLVGVPHLLAGTLTLIRAPYFASVGVLLGGLFIGWNYLHFVEFGLFSVMQPIYTVLGMVIIALGIFFLFRMEPEDYRQASLNV